MLTTLLVSPVTAQRDKFDTIQCRRLEVVDAAGKHSVIIDSASDRVGAYSKDGELLAVLGIDEDRGRFDAYGKDGKTALVGIGEVGGHVFIVDKYGNVESLD